MEYKEIKSITFGVLSSEEIIKNGVCEVSNTNLAGTGSVYDERMGIIENDKLCKSCGLNNKSCPGHYGYIKLEVPIFHPMFYKYIVNFLNMFCSYCSRLYVSEEHLYIDKIIYKFDKISEYISNTSSCYFCKSIRCTHSYISSDSSIVKNTKDGKVPVTSYNALAIFTSIIDDDLKLIGLNSELIRPKNLIMEYLPVIPIKSRPYIISDGNICDDDITIVYQSILKINNKYSDDKLDQLIFNISTLMNNSDGKSKHNNGGRPIKGIKERISGKDGIIRNNMSGKRVNQSARTVIGPDPTLKTNQVAIPEKFAQKLTIPENVTSFNINKLQNLVDSGKVNFVLRNKNKINLEYACKTQETEVLLSDTVTRNGVVITENFKKGDIITRDNEIIEYIPSIKRKYELKIGDIVERQLQDNDIILINRQPTLHKCSMLAKYVKIRSGKTIRLNLATTKVFNADFDGDEMNIHVPQDYTARIELENLASTSENIISWQSSKPNIALVQDGMLGTYLMTKNDYNIPKHIFMDMCMTIDYSYDKYTQVTTSMPLCGRALISLIIPNDFSFSKDQVKIENGMYLEGGLTKSILSSIVCSMYKDYGSVLSFLDNLQFVVNEWLLFFGFSIGIKDCIPSTDTQEKIQRNVTKCFSEAQSISNNVINSKIKNAKISMILAKAKDTGMKIAKESFSESNGFISTVTSGSKGDYFNICQITGLLGQQNVNGGRIVPVLNNGTRTLPHYPLEPVEENFESTGFVKNSFIHGINPKEYFFHAMSGREGVSDTALKTWKSGYTQRKMIKLLEDVQVKYDGTVRNSSNDIIQWEYANDGLDRTKVIQNNGNTDFCDISRIANRLNSKVKL